MTLCREPIGVLTGLLMLCCGASWLYWLKEIVEEVNSTLSKEQRLEWRSVIFGTLPTWSDLKRQWQLDWKIHSFWNDHVRLYPKSRARLYAAVSFLLFFLIPIVNLAFCLLFSSR